VTAETLEPGASGSIVARRHDVNANQLVATKMREMDWPVPSLMHRRRVSYQRQGSYAGTVAASKRERIGFGCT
jgi:transposase-like protein